MATHKNTSTSEERKTSTSAFVGLARLKKGILGENPILVQAIALCPVLAVTTNATNGIGMGLATTGVLLASCLVVCFGTKFIPSQVRIPIFIILAATFTTVVEALMEAYVPPLHEALGIFIALITVNCLVLARMEAFAAKNKPLAVIGDCLGMGAGFTVALVLIGAVREVLAFGTIFDISVLPQNYPGAILMILPPGGFFVLGFLIAGFTALRRKFEKPSAKARGAVG